MSREGPGDCNGLVVALIKVWPFREESMTARLLLGPLAAPAADDAVASLDSVPENLKTVGITK